MFCHIFRKLQMKPLNTDLFPETIRQIEFYDNKTELAKIAKLFGKPLTEENYINRFTNLVYMEEAANSRRLMEYDLSNVKITIDLELLTIKVVSS